MSMASHTCRVRSGASAAANTAMIMIRISSATRPSSSNCAVSCAICSLASLGLRGDLLLPLLKAHQHRRQGQLPAGHAPRQEVEVPVSRRAITSLIAQYTRDSAEAGRCS